MEISRFIAAYLEKIGLKAKLYDFKKRRSNVIAVIKGNNEKRSLLITPHLDTVPAGGSWKHNPFLAQIKRGRIYGLGATDCKGNLASSLEAINSIIEDSSPLNYNLIFAATADEESGSAFGIRPLLNKGILKPDQAIVLDSNEFNIIITQKGLLHLKIKIKGKRAHGAYPWRGENAIDIAVRILNDLKKHRFYFKKNQYLKPPTINIGTIRGGDKVNIVADWCKIELDLRFLPGMSAKNILKELRNIIQRYTKNYSIEIEGLQQPYFINSSHRLVKSLIQASSKEKVKAKIRGSEGATTISFFQDKGIPAVAFGFGSSGCAHTANEHVKIENLYKGAKILENFLTSYNF